MQRLTVDRAGFWGLAEDLLRRGGGLTFVARGASMTPTIRDGDAVTVRPLPAAGPRPGDVVLFRRADGRPVAHRVVARRDVGPRVLLDVRGDAAPDQRERVDGAQVVGHVVGVSRGGGGSRGGGVRAAGRRLVRAIVRRLLDPPDRP